MLLNCDVGEDSWESLGLQGDPTSQLWRKSVLNIHWKDWCWSWNSNTLATWCEKLTHLTLVLGKIEGRRRRGWQRMRWLDGITNSIDMRLGRLWELVVVHGVAKSRTRLSDWTNWTDWAKWLIPASQGTQFRVTSQRNYKLLHAMDFQGHLRTLKAVNAKSMSQGLIVLPVSAWYSIIIFSDNQNSIHLNEPLQAFIGFQISDFSVLAFAIFSKPT